MSVAFDTDMAKGVKTILADEFEQVKILINATAPDEKRFFFRCFNGATFKARVTVVTWSYSDTINVTVEVVDDDLGAVRDVVEMALLTDSYHEMFKAIASAINLALA